MPKFAGVLSLIGGIAVLAGNFVPNLNKDYYLIIAGGVLAILAGFWEFKSFTWFRS